jgi:hypothetical protein
LRRPAQTGGNWDSHGRLGGKYSRLCLDLCARRRPTCAYTISEMQ